MGALSVRAAGEAFASCEIPRRVLRDDDVDIEIDFCGICHSDISAARNEWRTTRFPLVPGHEIVGRVLAVGGAVTRFAVSDRVAVGCFVDACGTCEDCRASEENYCDRAIFTYNSRDAHLRMQTFGGYARRIVVREAFVLRVRHGPAELPGVAPLLCAGITVYSPLVRWGVGRDSRVGVVGLGGLGHLAVRLASAMGAHVVLFTSSPAKSADAMRLGAREAVVTSDASAMRGFANSLDLIIDTVSAPHDLARLVVLLRRDRTLVLVGAPDKPHSLSVFPLMLKRRSVVGSLIGSLADTQEMLDFCAERGIVADVELVRADAASVDDAFARVLRNDVKYRFVIDLATLQGPA